MELAGLQLRIWRLSVAASIDWGLDDSEDAEPRPMPHLEPVDEVQGIEDDGDDVDRLGFK